jgi:hypothetical protein
MDDAGTPMKRLAGVVFALVVMATTSAHIGSPNVVYDGTAGPYAVRVIVRPPEVVPGLADVTVRTDSTARRVNIRPVFWRAGVRGAPSGDDMTHVAGQPTLYTGQLWLMAYGSYSVYVTVDGPRGSGTAIVPVSSFATGRLPLSPALGTILAVLGVVLFAGLLSIIRAGAGESLVAPGEAFDPARRKRANRIAGVAAPLLALAIFGGWTWWNSEDAAYRRFLYESPAMGPTITNDAAHRTLDLVIRDTARFHVIYSPVTPDHGKMMHLFLIGVDSQAVRFAHLHPIQTDSLHFSTQVPWLPAGRYRAFGDLTLENGLSLTVTNTVDLPALAGRIAPTDSDDAWTEVAHPTPLSPGASAPVGDGYSIAWTGASTLSAKTPVDLRFTVRDASGKVVQLHPYLGMAAHAVVMRDDGSVFIHLHPMGTVATAGQQAFAVRDRGDTTPSGRLRTENVGASEMTGMPLSGDLDLPYEFPKAGRYRVFVQVKPATRVLTGVFDVDVR